MMAERITRSRAELTATERRVAEALVDDPSRVAFGTVADLAQRSGASGPSVLRLAGKLGFAGYVDLQAAVREELAGHLRPAVERIRAATTVSPLQRARRLEVSNVEQTLEAAEPGAFQRVVRQLADRRRGVHVLSGEASAGVASMLASELGLLRSGVAAVAGSEVAVARHLAAVAKGDVVVAIELRRYERWVLEAAAAAAERGAVLVAVTDGPLSPLATRAEHTFVVAAAGVGPFDSHVGTLALANALVAGVAARLRVSATARLDAVEAAWTAAGALVDQ